MAFTGTSQEKEAIRELYASYSDASACADSHAFLACFDENGEWHTHIFNRRGKTELLAQWEQLWLEFDKVGFLNEIGAIEVDGDRAISRCVAIETIRLKGGGVYKLIGQYRDHLVQRDGVWLFARREYEPIWEEVPV